jgi:hypothetical protein
MFRFRFNSSNNSSLFIATLLKFIRNRNSRLLEKHETEKSNHQLFIKFNRFMDFFCFFITVSIYEDIMQFLLIWKTGSLHQ